MFSCSLYGSIYKDIQFELDNMLCKISEIFYKSSISRSLFKTTSIVFVTANRENILNSSDVTHVAKSNAPTQNSNSKNNVLICFYDVLKSMIDG